MIYKKRHYYQPTINPRKTRCGIIIKEGVLASEDIMQVDCLICNKIFLADEKIIKVWPGQTKEALIRELSY